MDDEEELTTTDSAAERQEQTQGIPRARSMWNTLSLFLTLSACQRRLSYPCKYMTSVAASVGDNCSTNKLFATLAGTRFVSCASHRFNLAVEDILAENEDIIDTVHSLMTVKLGTLIISAKLRKLVSTPFDRTN